MIMGAYGANAVHMSVLQEYMAAQIGLAVGYYWQMSNDMHAYERDLVRYDTDQVRSGEYHRATRWFERYSCPYDEGIVSASPLFTASGAETVDEEICAWCENREHRDETKNPQLFEDLIYPMSTVHDLFRGGEREAAVEACVMVQHSDWRLAAEQWIRRRIRT
jgi:hypothetical protein